MVVKHSNIEITANLCPNVLTDWENVPKWAHIAKQVFMFSQVSETNVLTY